MITFEYIAKASFKPTAHHKIWLHQVIRHEDKIPGDISYIFCDDDYMIKQNITFLNHDTYTDIITFDECVGDIVAGSIIVEQVFIVPGLGRLLLLSISNRDYPVVLSIIMIISALVIFVNFLADVAYQLVDPRIRLK